MEPAIPKHLRCPRTTAMRMADGYEPKSPAWTSRWREDVAQLVMAYFGVQRDSKLPAGEAFHATKEIVALLHAAHGPHHYDVMSYVDEAAYRTYVVVAYWDDAGTFDAWMASEKIHAWWASRSRAGDGLGYFREIHRPSVARSETLASSTGKPEGVANLAEGFSGEVREHAYWGGMRDRLAVCQTDALSPSGEPFAGGASPELGERWIRVEGPENLALIRSGQDWGESSGNERRFYLEKLEPTLVKGMNFLRDHGLPIGCYFNRYMRHVDPSGAPMEKSFAVSAWRSLENLERWAESHPTHKAIFGAFLNMLESTSSPALRLYHEVSVLRACDQSFEYLDCHPRTGLLRSITDHSAK